MSSFLSRLPAIAVGSALALFALCGAMSTGRATEAKPAAKPAAKAGAGTNSVATNAEPVELVIPLSVFSQDATAKDPFYPNSVRISQQNGQTNVAPLIAPSTFILKGLSGAQGARLALINNRTLGAGETAEITTATGKLTLTCVEIRETSVMVKLEGQKDPIEIFLRKSVR